MSGKINKVTGNFKQVYVWTLVHRFKQDYVSITKPEISKSKVLSDKNKDLHRLAILVEDANQLDLFVEKWQKEDNKIYLQGDMFGSEIGHKLRIFWYMEFTSTNGIKDLRNSERFEFGYLNDKQIPCGISINYDLDTGGWLLTLMQNANDPDPEKRQVQLFYSDHFGKLSDPNNTVIVSGGDIPSSIEQAVDSPEVIKIIQKIIKTDGTIDEEYFDAYSNVLVSGCQSDCFNKKTGLGTFVEQSIVLGKENSQESLEKYIQNEMQYPRAEIQYSRRFQNKITCLSEKRA